MKTIFLCVTLCILVGSAFSASTLLKQKIQKREANIACPMHGCTAAMLGCTKLVTNENGCELCQCVTACPFHSCTKDMLGCSGELAKNENGCELCECEVTACPFHSCTKEMLGCSGELARNANGCELCECEAVVIQPGSQANEQDRGVCMLPADSGPCRGTHARYYFNRATNKCDKFLYGGCYGNGNNFEKLSECQAACISDISVRADVPAVACPYHSCTAESLNCPANTGLAINENNCELCECAAIACPMHSCTKEMLGCFGALAVNGNGCEICECAAVACPMHSCTKDMLGCSGALATNENGCEICECADQPVACPSHSCTKESLGCSGELAKNENGCKLCECEGVVIQPNQADVEQDRGVCMLPADSGPCRGTHARYYFNRATNKCDKFLYGGCYGNGNNFEKLSECQAACISDISVRADAPAVACPYHSCTAESLNCPANTGLAINENNCELCECAAIACPMHSCTKEMLGCSGELAVNENGCEICECAAVACPMHSCTKESLGCSGELARNENGCEICECTDQPVACPLHSCTKESLGCSGDLAKNENGCKLCECEGVVVGPGIETREGVENKGLCMLVPDAGTCKAFQTRYYFDRAADQCKEFIYGGCRGNENNFETLENCQNACKPSKVACPYHSCTPESLKCPTGSGLATNQNGCLLCECEGTVIQPIQTRTGEDRGVCMLPADSGPCRGTHARYYFNRATNKCDKFLYGGCYGNGNNFEKLEECQNACKADQSIKRKRFEQALQALLKAQQN